MPDLGQYSINLSGIIQEKLKLIGGTMPNPLIECIPNFSEGRRPEIVDAIIAEIKAIDGVTLLDFSLDSDHNRSVVTFVGTPKGVELAAFTAIKKAADLIDMENQEGEHPRIGATDVFPFVPISDISMIECVEIAKRVANKVGEELEIPVYLYEKAAAIPSRKNLANIRKGEYEGLKGEIEQNPDRKPDYGPSKLGSAGATVIGARSPLVAYNVYLNTDDVEIAKKIGKAVRHLSGGLRFVKGLGMLVDGQAQVSMNLTNFKRTPVFRVVEMIRREAARYGVQITHSELIGLIPQEALNDAATWYLQLNEFDSNQILETRMQNAQTEDEIKSNSSEFLTSLASGDPTPGGGSAAAYAGAMGASLVAMVARLSVGKKKYKEIEAQMTEIIAKADELQQKLTNAVKLDSDAFEDVMAAYKLPKTSDEEKGMRENAIEAAMVHAANIPLEVAEMAVEVMEMAGVVTEIGNLNAISDGASGNALAKASFTGASLNVRINLASIKDGEVIAKLTKSLVLLEKRVLSAESKVNANIKDRAGL